MILEVKNLPDNAGDAGGKGSNWSLGQEDSPGEGRQSAPEFLAWKIPWTEEPGGLRSMGSQRVGHGRTTKHVRACTHTDSI